MSRTKKELEAENQQLREVAEDVLDRVASILGYEEDDEEYSNEEYSNDEEED